MKLKRGKIILEYEYDNKEQRNRHMEEMSNKGWESKIKIDIDIHLIKKSEMNLSVVYEKEELS